MTNEQFFHAMEIVKKYVDGKKYNFNCQHDELWICVEPASVSKEDLAELETLGVSEREGGLHAFLSC